jgi:hypothetical protein
MWDFIAGAVCVGVGELVVEEAFVVDERVLDFDVPEVVESFVDEVIFDVLEVVLPDFTDEELDFEVDELLDDFELVLEDEGFADVEEVDTTDREVDVEDLEEVVEDFTDLLLLLLVASEESMYISSLFPAPQYSYGLPGQVNEQSERVVETDPALGEVPQ